MKKPRNRMAAVETMEQEPEQVVRPAGRRNQAQCPTCGAIGAVISEIMLSNRLVKMRFCEDCQKNYTEK